MEIAFLTSNKLRIELESKQGSIPARIFSYFNKFPSRYLGTMLLGNNIALVVFGIYMGELLSPIVTQLVSSEVAGLLIQTFLSTLFILVTAEFLPKNLFRINPNFLLNIFAIPLIIIYYILYPFVFITTGISEFILTKIFKVKFVYDKISFGRIDLDNYVREGTLFKEGQKEMDHEIQIFKNALEFSNVKARECMIPRTEIIALDVNDSVDKLKQKFIQTRLSKILIYENSIDHIIGYTHSHELFKNPDSIRSVLLPVSIVPESMPVREMLTVFIQQHKSIAVVVDEFGGTSGMLTMEDIIEEIFGEIEDEHDKDELLEKKLNNNEYLFSARLEIDYLNEKYKLQLPLKDNVETLGGLLLHYNESIPRLNEEIRVGQFIFKITGVSSTRIEQVQLKINHEV